MNHESIMRAALETNLGKLKGTGLGAKVVREGNEWLVRLHLEYNGHVSLGDSAPDHGAQRLEQKIAEVALLIEGAIDVLRLSAEGRINEQTADSWGRCNTDAIAAFEIKRWQDWATDLLDEFGRQPLHGSHGDEPAREVIAQLAAMAPGVPRCMECGCFSTVHEVDDEELRGCTDCACKQFEAPNG